MGAAGVAAGPANLSGWTMPGAESGLRARAGPPARLSNFLFRGREDDAVNLNSALIDAGPALSRAGVAAGVAAGPANLFQDGRCLARSPDREPVLAPLHGQALARKAAAAKQAPPK